MEEDMEDFVDGQTYASDDEFGIDSDYEFDAATFFDFTIHETLSQIQEAEKWFHFANTYPSSPFIVRLNLEKIFTSKSEDVRTMTPISSNNSDVVEVKMKKVLKSRSSTLMKPTLSLLAKQDKLQDVHLSRTKKSLAKLDEKSLHSPSGNLATKRQRLESGYLRKIGQLNHQTSPVHKIVKKDGSLSYSSQHSKLKVTIPKEPQLETMQRAQRHRLKVTSESSADAKLKVHNFNSRRLNGKVSGLTYQIHDSLSPKRQMPDNQFAKLKTLERVTQHSSLDVPDSDVQSGIIDVKSSNLEGEKDKCEVWLNVEVCDLSKKESSISSDESLSQNLPIESFSKLSIKSENLSNSVSQAKFNKYTMDLKGNSPGSFQQDFWKCAGKPNQCGGDNIILEMGHHRNYSRSLDIH